MGERWIRWTCIVALLGALTGCVPDADQPLTDPGRDAIDAAMLGTWYWNEEGENGFVHIGTNEAGDRLHLLMITHYRDGEMEVGEFSGHPSVIGGNIYLNLKAARPYMGAPEGVFFMKVIPSDTSLGVAFMDPDTVKAAIGAGTLKGTVGRPGDSRALHITDTPARLRDFILRHDATLYATVKVLPRLVLPKS